MLTPRDLKNLRKTISRQKLSSFPARPTSQEATLQLLSAMKNKEDLEEYKYFIGYVDMTKKCNVLYARGY